MQVIAYIIFLILFFLLQSTLLAIFTIGGTIPNLLLILVATVGFLHGRKKGLILGFFAGFIIDVFFGPVIGLYALIYMYIGFANGCFKKLLYQRDYKLPIILIIGSDFVYGNICYLLLFFLRGDFKYLYYLSHTILPEVIYTALLTFILYPALNAVFSLIDKAYIDE